MTVALLDLNRATAVAKARKDLDLNDPATIALMDHMAERKRALDPEMTRFAALCDRWDNLYYPQFFTAGGASHWAQHPSAKLPGQSHVSVNVYPVYVDVPASLTSVPPMENMVAADADEDSATIAAEMERFYFAWKREVDFELQGHRACVVKSLYGRTASKVYWDDEKGYPVVDVVDQPRNLYLGWRDSNYEKLDWALYTYRITPATAMEDWGLRIGSESDSETGVVTPYVIGPLGLTDTSLYESWLSSSDLQVEVYDYWYRRPKKGSKLRFGKPTKFETWNAVFVGNALVKNAAHREYDGSLPYVPLFNTYIPGLPEGRPELYDVEQLIREKDERLSENAQMMSRAVNGQYWQLTGQEAPSEVPIGLKPVPNQVVAPGPGNRIEALQPWMPEFQMEAFLSRLDREMADVTGLNDLLRGLAPSQVLSSGKAIAALVANYETRIRMKRDLYYRWRVQNWELASIIWANKNSKLKPVMERKVRLLVEPPSLTPRDDAEVATIAQGLVMAKLWSAKRGMDKTGVEDPETEQDIIRDEQTDATLNPAAVQVMAQLLGILKAQGIQPQPEVQEMVETQAKGLADTRALTPGPPGQPMLNDPNAQPQLPPEAMPANTPEGMGFAPAQGAEDLTLQTAIKGGEANSRILQQSRITSQPQGEG